MKKILLKSCLTVAFALCAQATMAEYLYCAIGDGSSVPTYSYDPFETVSYDYATIVMVSADGSSRSDYLKVYGGGETSPSGITVASGSNEPFYAELPENYSDTYNTFLFELWTSNQAGAIKEAWQRYSLADVTGSIVGGSSPSGGSPLAVTSVIPEPTGGVLMLLGVAALAMRRKDKKVLN